MPTLPINNILATFATAKHKVEKNAIYFHRSEFKDHETPLGEARGEASNKSVAFGTLARAIPERVLRHVSGYFTYSYEYGCKCCCQKDALAGNKASARMSATMQFHCRDYLGEAFRILGCSWRGFENGMYEIGWIGSFFLALVKLWILDSG